MRSLLLLGLALVAIAPVPLFAHPGGLNSEGCHNNRRTGGYHCHRGSSAARSLLPSARSRARDFVRTARRRRASYAFGSSSGAFANCSQARAAGAAPVRAGDRGYGRHLDRDNDGVGCE